jgi:hypothetical protein
MSFLLDPILLDLIFNDIGAFGYRDIQVLKTYGAAPYAAGLKKLEKEIKEKQQSVNEKIGVKVGCCEWY